MCLIGIPDLAHLTINWWLPLQAICLDIPSIYCLLFTCISTSLFLSNYSFLVLPCFAPCLYRSSQLKCLHVAFFYDSISESWSELFKKLPLLEELSLTFTNISNEAIAYAGQYCPMLRSFKLKRGWRHNSIDHNTTEIMCFDEEAIAIAKHMTQLRHLQLIGNNMTNKGLRAILDGCPHLVSLDLWRCFNINLDGVLGKRCSEQIKDLKLPEDSFEGYEYGYHIMSHDYDNSDYEGLSDYDIYCGPYYNHYEEFLAVFGGMHLEDLSDSD